MRFPSLRKTLRHRNKLEMMQGNTIPSWKTRKIVPIEDPRGYYWSITMKKKLRIKLNAITPPNRISIHRMKDQSERLLIAGLGGEPLADEIMRKFIGLGVDVSKKQGNYVILEHEIVATLLELKDDPGPRRVGVPRGYVEDNQGGE